MGEEKAEHRAEHAVAGMTCGHCVRHVREEVAAIEGVLRVEVSLEGGRLEVVSDRPVPTAEIAAALAEAGDYTLVEA